jgi:hypothetical protein
MGKGISFLFASLGKLASSGIAVAAFILVFGVTPGAQFAEWWRLFNDAPPAWLMGWQGRLLVVAVGLSVIAAILLYRQHQIAALEKDRGFGTPRSPVRSLHVMSISDIAIYVRDESAWAWQERLRLTFPSALNGSVPMEITRAAKAYQVRFVGCEPNSLDEVEIPRSYWQAATIDRVRVWDKRNAFFTVSISGLHGTRVVHYQHGFAPTIEVMQTWPQVSLFYKPYVKMRLKWRAWRYGIDLEAKE